MTREERQAEFLRIARRCHELLGLDEERRIEIEILSQRMEQLKREEAAQKNHTPTQESS